MRRREALEPYIAPLVILALAALVTIAALLPRPEPKAVSVPIDLSAGAIRTIEFRAAYSMPYIIGIEMDQPTALRLFPCMADSSSAAFGMCTANQFPLALSLTLIAEGARMPEPIQPNRSRAGGSSAGTETFTREVGHAVLSSGETYRLTVQSMADGTPLAPTHPRLVVEVPAGLHKDGMVLRAIAVLIAAALALVGAIWAVIVRVLRWVRARRSASARA